MLGPFAALTYFPRGKPYVSCVRPEAYLEEILIISASNRLSYSLAVVLNVKDLLIKSNMEKISLLSKFTAKNALIHRNTILCMILQNPRI